MMFAMFFFVLWTDLVDLAPGDSGSDCWCMSEDPELGSRVGDPGSLELIDLCLCIKGSQAEILLN